MNTLELLALVLVLVLGGLGVAAHNYRWLERMALHPRFVGVVTRARLLLTRWRVMNRYSELGGYVRDTAIYVWVPFTRFAHSAGTWTTTLASNVWFTRRTAADAAATTYIPLGGLLQSANRQQGSYIKSVDIHFRVVTAALDALEAHLYRATLAADGSLLTVAEITTTYDTGHDTAAERIDVDEHKMTLTPSSPEWADDGYYYFVEVVTDGSAAGVLDFFGARVALTLSL